MSSTATPNTTTAEQQPNVNNTVEVHASTDAAATDATHATKVATEHDAHPKEEENHHHTDDKKHHHHHHHDNPIKEAYKHCKEFLRDHDLLPSNPDALPSHNDVERAAGNRQYQFAARIM